MGVSGSVARLKRNFSAGAERVFAIDAASGRSLTFREFARVSLRLAEDLRARGLRPGDAVAFLAGNSLELALLYFAVWHCGAKVVPVYQDLPDDQIGAILRGAECRFLIAEPDPLRRSATAGSWTRLALVPKGRDFGAARPAADALDMNAAFSEGPVGAEPFFGLEDASAFLRIYTSGSTAAPKGIDVCAGRLVANEVQFCDFLRVGADHRFYNILPMSYLGGVHNLLLLPFSVQASVVIDQPFGPGNMYAFWEVVRRHGINALWFSPTIVAMLLALRDDEDMSWVAEQVRIALVGMAPLAQSTKRDFEARYRIRLLENYAMSEIAFVSSHRLGVETDPASKGHVMPGIDVAFVDADLNRAPPGEIGEIMVRTPHFMLGYAGATEADNANIRGEWFLTGDIGRLRNGELYVVDRKKDLIIRGGLNIAPAVVEEALYRHPSVKEAAVYGMPDAFYGEEVAAAVSLADDMTTASGLIEFAASQLPPFQRPKRIDILADLPKGLTGKIDKKALRARLFPKL